MDPKIPLLVIVGPTAVGKTNTAVRIAKKYSGEVVSADSMQIYKYMDIGTAKPTAAEKDGIKHHLIDIVEPDEEYSVSDFKEDAQQIIKKIYSNKKLPILAGGTGLYIKAVVDNYYFSEASVDRDFRNKMKHAAMDKGNEYVFNKLKKVDPVSAQRIHPNDTKRIIRALEVYHQTGKPISYYEAKTKNTPSPYNAEIIGLYMPREILYERINKRVDIMIERGLVKEVKKLVEKGYDENLNSMKGLGYQQIIKYLKGEYTLDEAIKIIKRDTRRFAKRQFTWFRRDKRIYWINPLEVDPLEAAKEKIEGLVKELN